MGGARIPLALGVVALTTVCAGAEIKDHQIARMLSLRTDCILVVLRRVEPRAAEVERFLADCANRTFYPDGIEISCPEENDEWTCQVATERKSFNDLDMLKRDP